MCDRLIGNIGHPMMRFFADEEHVAFADRVDIKNSDANGIFADNFGRDFTFDNSGKNRVVHGVSIYVTMPRMQITDLQKILLTKRGITDESEQLKFLTPDYSRDTYDPLTMHDMERAVVRIFEAVEAKEKIIIYSDYDCDGIPGGVILHDLLKKIGYENFENYIPNRGSEGYGLNRPALEALINPPNPPAGGGGGAKVIITVDLGITAVEDVAFCMAQGVDVIITDHHLPPAEIPRAYAIVHPKLGTYGDPMLCGAGVAWKVAHAFILKYGEYFKVPEGWEKWLLDLAGLATLSDMVPLTNENRAFAHYGLAVIRKSPRVGLVALFRELDIDQRYVTEDDLSFMVIPRLNAASRMDDPRLAFRLLATTDPVEAKELAKELSRVNDSRKTLVASLMKRAKHTLDARELGPVIVIGDISWRPGILGLMAGKICDEYQRPAFVWGSDNGEQIRGSCRSDGSVNVVTLMNAATESFIGFGGHELAGGFEITRDAIHTLEETLSAQYKKIAGTDAILAKTTDHELALADINRSRYGEISALAPFGTGNAKPLFTFLNVTVTAIKHFGKEKNHLELIIGSGPIRIKAIQFFKLSDDYGVNEGDTINLLAHYDLSRFAGREELRLRIVDIQK